MMDDGVQSTKVYMTYGYKIDDDGILEVLKKMKELHGITAVSYTHLDVYKRQDTTLAVLGF